MVRHISTLLAVPSQAHTRLSPMGLTRSAPTVESSSLRIGWQDSLVTHGPIALRCPGSGRFPPMNAPLISVSFPNIVRNSRSRPIECEFWKMLQGHVLHQKKSGTHSQVHVLERKSFISQLCTQFSTPSWPLRFPVSQVCLPSLLRLAENWNEAGPAVGSAHLGSADGSAQQHDVRRQDPCFFVFGMALQLRTMVI